ncbi:hypothetical protein KIN34_01165 [Cellulomonas sp. DKR-3]|uniref:Lipopolysaccharide biosynthesis protein n=1 Tax=Cellulomonas fulva TaxID=2835530 RepID=A0ABS5TUX2_9CELL|nr:hypothetical protein [Cellulomonas fulva]MBT0992901.1 hypothetical protein [Cellulomonas fulva]
MSTEETPGVDVREYGRVVLRRWRVVLACTLLGGLGAAAYLYVTPVESTATSVVNLTLITSDPYDTSRSAAGLVDMQTEAQTAQSTSVAILAAGRLGDGTTPEALRRSVTVTAIDSTTIMRVAATDISPQRARARADAVAESFLAYRAQQAGDRIDTVVRQGEARLASLRDDLAEANATLQDADPASNEASQAETDRQLITLQINAVLTRTSTFESIDTNGGTILTSAESNRVVTAPDRTRILAMGVLAGLGLGLVGAFVRDASDRRVRVGSDLARLGAGPVIGRVHLKGTSQPAVAATVREHILGHHAVTDGTGVVAVVPCGATSSPWELVGELARSFADAGIRVRVVGAGPQAGPQLARALHLEDVTEEPAEGRRSPTQPLVSLWSAGGDGWLGHVRADADAHRSTDLVLLVGTTTVSEADVMSLSRISDALVLVAADHGTRRATIASVLEAASLGGRPVIGSVVVPSRRTPAHAVHEVDERGHPVADEHTAEILPEDTAVPAAGQQEPAADADADAEAMTDAERPVAPGASAGSSLDDAATDQEPTGEGAAPDDERTQVSTPS